MNETSGPGHSYARDDRASQRWRIAVDTGGTFTDCLAMAPDGRVHRAKVLSNGTLRGTVRARMDPGRICLTVSESMPRGFLVGFELSPLRTIASTESAGDHVAARIVFHDADGVVTLDRSIDLAEGDTVELRGGEEAAVLGARLVTGTPLDRPLPVADVLLATTRGTNALLERRVARTVFLVTAGFEDLLVIGDQRRPHLFARTVVRPAPLHDVVIGVRERRAADGRVLEPLTETECDRVVSEVVGAKVDAVAIAFLHAWRDPTHERQLAVALERAGIQRISVSSTLSATIRVLPRATTAIVDASLSPIIGRHLDEVRRRMDAGRIRVMTSAGGLAAAALFRAKDSLLSGPAGGVAGAAAVARRLGFTSIIGFDMGGTSTDVARVSGDFEYIFEHRVGDVEIASPAIAIETVAAGGGSICALDGPRLSVGPASAGAAPGPACYGCGGPLTVTDVDLLLGRLDPRHMRVPVDTAAARAAAQALAEAAAHLAGGAVGELEPFLEGLVEIADEKMADAIAAVSIRRGHDPAAHALLAFGGAGGLHACSVAERLDMRTIILPRDAGLLSAAGLLAARPQRVAERQVIDVLERLDDERLRAMVEEAATRARAQLLEELADGAEPAGYNDVERTEIRRVVLRMRLLGQESCVDVDAPPLHGTLSLDWAREAFSAAYRRLYGHAPRNRPIELESIRVVVVERQDPVATVPVPDGERSAPVRDTAAVFSGGAWRRANVYELEQLRESVTIAGPALLLSPHSSAWIAPEWRGSCRDGAIVLQRVVRKGVSPASRSHLAPVPEAARRAVFSSRLESIATEMGELLRRTALSVNVKERLDFSCGLLDADGQLVVNAPHIPVHLGALGVCVRSLRERIDLQQGDVVVTNHPAFGGSHLPDVTVVTPIFDDGRRLLGYAASRAHHAEIGGIRPGSMPADACALDEEGVIIAPMHVVRHGQARLDRVEALLRGGPHPSRAVADNLADLEAAIAANQHGAERVRALAAEVGSAECAALMALLTDHAAMLARQAIAALPAGRREVHETLDDGTPLAVSVERDGGRLRIDFTGTGGVHPRNFNATPAIVRSAVMYVVRLLVDESIPLNEGLLRDVSIHVPTGLLSPIFREDPARCPPVGAGNTETSQRIVGLLVRALDLAAASQGTMNNVLFGNDRFGYYETLGGGAGATAAGPGASGVHTHMSNTRITDPEVLEQRYPVRLETFALRRGSGGAGFRRGGDGLLRRVRFLEPVELSVVTGRRTSGPPGAAGGADGAPGAQRLLRHDGAVVDLPPCISLDAHPGDRLEIETPGGGGWGAPAKR